MFDDWNGEGDGLVWRLEAKPAIADRLVVGAAGNQKRVVAMLVQPAADRSANSPRSEHHEPHEDDSSR